MYAKVFYLKWSTYFTGWIPITAVLSSSPLRSQNVANSHFWSYDTQYAQSNSSASLFITQSVLLVVLASEAMDNGFSGDSMLNGVYKLVKLVTDCKGNRWMKRAQYIIVTLCSHTHAHMHAHTHKHRFQYLYCVQVLLRWCNCRHGWCMIDSLQV